MAAAGKAVAPPYPPPGVIGESSLSRVSFLGARLPAEVEAMAKSVRDLGKETFRKLLKVSVSALEGRDCKESVKTIVESTSLSDEQLAVLISGMYTLLREALRLPASSLKEDVFKEDLKELRIPEEFIVDFATVVFGNRRPMLEATIQSQANRLPRIDDFKWRVDVAISTRNQTRNIKLRRQTNLLQLEPQFSKGFLCHASFTRRTWTLNLNTEILFVFPLIYGVCKYMR